MGNNRGVGQLTYAGEIADYHSTPSTSSLITSSLLVLFTAPSNQYQVDASVQDYFLIKLVQTLRHSSQITRERARQQEEMVANGLLPPVSASGTIVNVVNASGLASTCARTSPSGIMSVATKGPVNGEEEAIRAWLDALGVHVGANLAEW